MKVAVSYAEDGTILTMFEPEKLQGNNGFLTYVPANGERHHVIDVPKEYERTPFMDLPQLLRVNARGGRPTLEPRA